MTTPAPAIERLSHSRAVCTVTFTEEQVGPAEQVALERLGSQMHLKGFRPGKAPAEMVRKGVNQEQLFEETIRELLRISLPGLIEQHQLKPIMAPKVEAVSRLPLTLKITFIEYPVVKVKDSTTFKIEKKEVKADPKDVQKVIDSVLAEQRTMKPVERAAAKGDRIVIDFTATDEGGTDIPELKAQQYDVLIGDASLLPGFEEELVGLAANDSKSFTIKLPEKYATETLRGKPVTFHVKAARVEEVKTPELTDELAKEKLNADSAKAFRDMVEKSILSQEEQFEAMRRERSVMEEIAKRTTAEIAPEILEDETRSLLEEWSDRLQRQGLTIEEWMKREKKEAKEIEADMRKQAEERARLRFGVAKLIEERKITLSSEEIQDGMENFLHSLPDDQKKQAENQLQPGSSLYQEIVWRTTVEKLMKELLA